MGLPTLGKLLFKESMNVFDYSSKFVTFAIGIEVNISFLRCSVFQRVFDHRLSNKKHSFPAFRREGHLLNQDKKCGIIF